MEKKFKKAHYRSIPAWFNEETNEIFGRNWFYDILIDINVWFDVTVFQTEDFPIYIEEEKNN